MSISLLIVAVDGFYKVLVYMILAHSILSWFIRSPQGSLYKIYIIIGQITEPILAPCRKLLSRFGMFGPMDFSPIVAILGLFLIRNILVRLIVGFGF